MSNLTDATIDALRAHHDDLAAFVAELSEDQLSGPSGAAEWSLAQVFSHLGSGAEISMKSIGAAVDAPDDPEEPRDNESVWARWNAATPREQADRFVEQDERLVAMLESVDAGVRRSARVDLGFLPEPVPLVTALGMRLNEVAAHAWDAHVGLDPQAHLDPTSADLLLEHFTGGIGFLLGFVGKAEEVGEPTTVALGGYGLVVDGSVTLVRGAAGATAAFEGPSEAAVRLLSGRLAPEHTPEGVRVTGNVDLQVLRRVFPGY